jgi:putative transposase
MTIYQKDTSTREIGKFVEMILGEYYSATTISNITPATIHDIRAWRERTLHKRYVALYLDAMFIEVRRDIVAKVTSILHSALMSKGAEKSLVFTYVDKNRLRVGLTYCLI